MSITEKQQQITQLQLHLYNNYVSKYTAIMILYHSIMTLSERNNYEKQLIQIEYSIEHLINEINKLKNEVK